MENSFQTSFIPKKPIVSNSSIKVPKSFLSLITSFFLIVSILASIGLFLYKTYLNKQIISLSASLAQARGGFEKDTIDELALFDKRITSAQNILNNHIVLSPLFSLLNKITIPSVQYTSFNEQVDDTGFLVQIKGVAKDYRSIILQSNIFSGPEGSSFKNVLFYDLFKDKSNNINFSLKFNVNPEIHSYKENLKKVGSTNNTPPIDINTPLTDNNNTQ